MILGYIFVEQYGNIGVLVTLFLTEVCMANFVYLEIEGKRATLAYWARHFGVAYDVFKMRYSRHGLDLAKLCAPVQRRIKRK